MDIRILGYRAAVRHVPVHPTLALRIISSDHESPILPLAASPQYTIRSYTFDDQDIDFMMENDPDLDIEGLHRRQRLFDPQIAERMLEDFEALREGKLELLVHCTLGASRSPAVAMAFNAIFGLGADEQALRERYQVTYNRYIYRILIETAQLHGFPHAHPEDL